MPDVYTSGTYIPELDGRAHGAVTIACHAPTDLEFVYAITALAPRPPKSPLASLAYTVAQGPIDWRQWWLEWRSGGGHIHPLTPPPASPSGNVLAGGNEPTETVEVEDSDIEVFKQVISALYYLWTSHPDDAQYLTCCISLAVAESGKPSLEWTGTRPALAFGQGSLWAKAGIAAWSARGFLAGLVLGDGIDAAARRDGLVDNARTTAIAKLGGAAAAPLLDLRTLEAGQIQKGSDLCVLMHGLCSTDVGTFDQFEAQIRSRSGKTGNATLTVVGFPHDSLTADIETNARDLVQRLVQLGARNVRLVCHSRGGLVARRAAALCRQEAKRPNAVGIHSCVTFGTPHLGTSVASSPALLTAAIMSAAHLHRSPSVSAVADILCTVKPGSTWRSVAELRPVEEEHSCLQLLRRHEEDYTFIDDGLPLRAFGSTGPNPYRRRDWKTRFIERIVGTRDHDLLVPIASSVPALRGPNPDSRLQDRNHFQYFSRLDVEGANDPPFWNTAFTALGLPNP